MYDRNPSNLRPWVSNVLKQNKTHMAFALWKFTKEWESRAEKYKEGGTNSRNYSSSYVSHLLLNTGLGKLL